MTYNWTKEKAEARRIMDKKVLEPYSNAEFRKRVCTECDDKGHCEKTDSDIQNCLIAFTPLEVE